MMEWHPYARADQEELRKLRDTKLGEFHSDCESLIKEIRGRDPFLGSKDAVHRAFSQCDFAVIDVVELTNRYWPNCLVIENMISPWWMVMCAEGHIIIGRRKRVIEIDYRYTNLRKIITEDDTTKTESLVHAHNENKMFEYLKDINYKLRGVIT